MSLHETELETAAAAAAAAGVANTTILCDLATEDETVGGTAAAAADRCAVRVRDVDADCSETVQLAAIG